MITPRRNTEAVVIEGDLPLEWADLVAYVARPSSTGPGLLCRISRDHQEELEQSLAALERAMESPESLVRFLLGEFGLGPVAPEGKAPP